MKKSWHPSTFRNQKRLWEVEEASKKEQQKLIQLRKEKQAERETEELKKLQEQVGIISTKPERVEWMYSACGTSANNDSISEEYLLGRRRHNYKQSDNLNEQVKAISSPLLLSNSPRGTSPQDIQKHLREDPLFVIKKAERNVQGTSDKVSTRPYLTKASCKRVLEKDFTIAQCENNSQ